MMAFARMLFLYMGIASTLFLVVGLFRPWVMLWWEDTQNRKKIFKLYGVLSLLFYLIYLIMGFFLR